MDYIYDIVLNFLPEYYDFYEWKPTDKIINLKKIPIYKISNSDYLQIKNSNVTIDLNTLPKKSKIIALTSGLEVMAILVNKYGKVRGKSSLVFEENDDVLKDKDSIKKANIKYVINKTNNNELISRISKEKIDYINKSLKQINKDEYLLKYIYYDIYNKEEKDISTIYNKLIELTKTDIGRLYEGIKNVNTELKKLS